MEGEIKNFVLVWTTILASLWYCHAVSKIFPTGNPKALSILPIACLFLVLPLNFTSIHFGGITSFIISWLASFKLILFAFNAGPLSSNPPIPLARFIPLACFPIKLQQSHDPKSTARKVRELAWPLSYIAKILISAILIRSYHYKKYMHPHIVLSLYSLHMYVMIEMILAIFASVSKALIRVELEPQFDQPYLATSLRDFWGRRWNLMVSNILKQTVYGPVWSLAVHFVSKKWAHLLAVMATFFVSGLMHELVFYNIGRLRPTGEVTCFFVIHGASLVVETVVKKMFDGKLVLPRIVSRMLTLFYVMYTSFWLFYPPLLRAKADFKGCTESLAFIEFVKSGRIVDPSDLPCPFL